QRRASDKTLTEKSVGGARSPRPTSAKAIRTSRDITPHYDWSPSAMQDFMQAWSTHSIGKRAQFVERAYNEAGFRCRFTDTLDLFE
ncbi:hypothetical protein PFISCL1PPCAC_3720, partial [Pristionchus fissidentatus]